MSVESLSGVLQQLLPEPHAGLLIGLLFGTKSSLSRDFYNALVTTGTIHIIALSGMNITIIMDMIAKSILPWVGKRWASLVSIAVIVWFVFFVGPSATIIRAAIMGSLSLLAVVFGRQYLALASWGLAVGVMLLIDISWIGDISFQLSALATLGIILFASKVSPELANKNLDPPSVSGIIPRSSNIQRESEVRLNFIRSPGTGLGPKIMQSGFFRMMKSELHLTLAAQVFTIPLILFHFHRLSLVSPLANLAIGWVVPLLTVLGWVVAVTGSLLLPVGQVFAWIAWVLLEYMITVVRIASTIPGASVGW